jgi:hypothetical protein
VDLKADNAAGAAPGPTTAQTSRAAAGTTGVEVKLSPGGVAELIKLSEEGALVETSSRFSIGASVALCIGGPSPRRLPGRVVRCQVCGIHRDNTMIYQIGLGFDAAAPVDVVEVPPVDIPEAPETVATAHAAGRTDPVELINEW